jgi:hypothetical protein
MRTNGDVARADFRHAILWRVVPFNLLTLRLLGLREVSNKNAIAEPFLFRSFECGEKDCAIDLEQTLSVMCHSNVDRDLEPFGD